MKTKTKNKSLLYLIVVTVVFTLGAAAIITAHLIISGTFLPDVSTSISRYVGMKLWSAIAYILLTVTVSVLMLLFLHSMKMPVLYRVCGYIVILFLLLIAFFPHTAFGETSTDIHQIVSRALFVSMMLHTLSGVICLPKRKRFLIPNFVVLAIDFALLFVAILSWQTFSSIILLLEFTLIYAYIVSLYTACRELSAEKV